MAPNHPLPKGFEFPKSEEDYWNPYIEGTTARMYLCPTTYFNDGSPPMCRVHSSNVAEIEQAKRERKEAEEKLNAARRTVGLERRGRRNMMREIIAKLQGIDPSEVTESMINQGMMNYTEWLRSFDK